MRNGVGWGRDRERERKKERKKEREKERERERERRRERERKRENTNDIHYIWYVKCIYYSILGSNYSFCVVNIIPPPIAKDGNTIAYKGKENIHADRPLVVCYDYNKVKYLTILKVWKNGRMIEGKSIERFLLQIIGIKTCFQTETTSTDYFVPPLYVAIISLSVYRSSGYLFKTGLSIRVLPYLIFYLQGCRRTQEGRGTGCDPLSQPSPAVLDLHSQLLHGDGN